MVDASVWVHYVRRASDNNCLEICSGIEAHDIQQAILIEMNSVVSTGYFG